jgi:GH25 family lysozyme M1 (1,4-beta-N-acetylmuramidase)
MNTQGLAQLIDLSVNNPADIDFPQVVRAVNGMYFKATEGVNYTDGHFWSYVQAAKRAAARWFGAYHYLRIRAGQPQDAEQQANQFADHYIQAGCTLPPMVDVEGAENGGVTEQEAYIALKSFLLALRARIPKTPLIYTDKGEWEAFGLHKYPEFAQMGELWIAAVGASQASAVAPFTTWRIWQYTWSVQIPGITGNVDGSFFAGDANAFEAWAGGGGGLIGSSLAVGGIASVLAYAFWHLWKMLGK